MSSKRVRGRGGGRNSGRKITPFRNQVFDSNGPDVRVRGTASQVFEKYTALARDAASNGDHIAAEGYSQHAEHYHRLHSAMNGGGQPGRGPVEQKAQPPGQAGAAAVVGPSNGKDASSESTQSGDSESLEAGVGSETSEPDQTPI